MAWCSNRNWGLRSANPHKISSYQCQSSSSRIGESESEPGYGTCQQARWKALLLRKVPGGGPCAFGRVSVLAELEIAFQLEAAPRRVLAAVQLPVLLEAGGGCSTRYTQGIGLSTQDALCQSIP